MCRTHCASPSTPTQAPTVSWRVPSRGSTGALQLAPATALEVNDQVDFGAGRRFDESHEAK